MSRSERSLGVKTVYGSLSPIRLARSSRLSIPASAGRNTSEAVRGSSTFALVAASAHSLFRPSSYGAGTRRRGASPSSHITMTSVRPTPPSRPVTKPGTSSRLTVARTISPPSRPLRKALPSILSVRGPTPPSPGATSTLISRCTPAASASGQRQKRTCRSHR